MDGYGVGRTVTAKGIQMAFKTIIVEIDDHVAVIKLNRPDALNALNSELMGELATALREAEANEKVRCTIITGSEKAFAAGADISEFAGMESLDAHRFAARGQAVFTSIENTPKPVVAAVNGFAVGAGCMMALACDIRIASENAQFGIPEIKLGIPSGMGAPQRLPGLIPFGAAMEMLLTGRRVSAAEALSFGLIGRVVEDGKALETALELDPEALAQIGKRYERLDQLAMEHLLGVKG